MIYLELTHETCNQPRGYLRRVHRCGQPVRIVRCPPHGVGHCITCRGEAVCYGMGIEEAWQRTYQAGLAGYDVREAGHSRRASNEQGLVRVLPQGRHAQA